jgi:tetratricopeptide (TPR) repeat protein
MAKLVLEGQTLARDRKQPRAAIEKCDKVIAAYKAAYGNRKVKIYCARSPAESAGYLFMAATGLPGTSGKGYDAIVLSSTWSDAYYMKAYALQDMGRIAEAKSALKQALELSPWDSYCWSELGSIYQVEKNWPKAKEYFEEAEAQAQKSPDDIKARDLARARRGVGYVLVEMGKLNEAEKKYQQCLAANPKDTKAAQELEYVRGLRAKTKSK